MTKFLKVSAALLLTGALTGCGGFEMLALIPVHTTTTTVTTSVGRSIADMLFGGLTCALTAGLDIFAPAVEIKFEAAEFNFVAEEIRTKNITDPKKFWAQIDQNESFYLRSLVHTSYDRLTPASIELMHKPVEYYVDLLAMGLMNAVKENVQVSRISFARHVKVSKDPIRYETYMISVNLRHAGAGEPKIYSTCE